MNDPAPRSLPEASAAPAHETSDVRPRLVALAALGLLLTVGFVLWLLGWTFDRFRVFDRPVRGLQSPPLVLQNPPAPRLQTDPAADLALWRHEQQSRRAGYGWIDGQADLVRIPVDRAMEILAERGFPEPEGHPQASSPPEARP